MSDPQLSNPDDTSEDGAMAGEKERKVDQSVPEPGTDTDTDEPE